MVKISKIKIKSFLIGIIIGLVLAGTGVYAAIMYQSSEVGYDNSNSGLTSTNVQAALDELYEEQQIPSPNSFSTDSWSTIKKAIKSGNTSNYNVGDTKIIDMGSLGTHTLRIANKSTPSECSGSGFSQTACGFVIEFEDIITTHRMNPWDSSITTSGNGNIGGWPASELRTYVNSDIYNALPTDLKSAIINTTVVSGHGSNDSSNFTSTDKLYLLSTHEVYKDVDGKTNSGIDPYDTAYNNTRQLDYYSSQNVTTSYYSGAIKQYNSSNSYWWLCSAYSNINSTFYHVYNTGNWSYYTSNATYGVSPAFRIG